MSKLSNPVSRNSEAREMKGVPKKLIESDKHVRNVKYFFFFAKGSLSIFLASFKEHIDLNELFI